MSLDDTIATWGRSLAPTGTAPLVVLTGAGISAESGIPTFRGPECYWTVGSTNYRPEELATQRAFRAMPDDVWAWYLHRRSVCLAAEPNAAHRALVALERALGPAFVLVTQNVDGLHRRAGHAARAMMEIHGNLHRMRCVDECEGLVEVPSTLGVDWPRGARMTDVVRDALRCARCGAWMRPHVLFFDESYDERLFFYESALSAALHASALVVIGTSGATNLPTQIVHTVARRGAPLLVINRERSPFSELAEMLPNGTFVEATAVATVPALSSAWG